MARWGQGSVYLRNRTWWVQYYRHGKAYNESARTDSERKARSFLRQRMKEADGDNFIGPAAQRVMFEDLEKVLLANYKLKNNRSTDLAQLALRRLRETFGNDRAVDISADRIQGYAADRLERGLSSSSVNYDLAILRRAFNVAKDTNMLTAAPKITLLPAAEARQGFLEPSDFARLRDALPDYLKDAIAFLYLSGWRVGEMRSLEWRDVDLASRAIRLRSENSKNKRGRVLKLGGGELLAIFQRAHECRRLDCNHVFHRDGLPIGDFRKVWKRACRTAGLGKVLVHDMRRSSVRNSVRAGVSERVAMGVSGHKTRTVFDRYDIIAEADLDAAADRIDTYVSARQNDAAKVVPLASKMAG